MKTPLLPLIACAAFAFGCNKNEPAAPVVEVRGEAIQPLAMKTNAPVTNAVSPKATNVAAKAEEKIGEYIVAGFDRLASFNYDVPDAPATNATKQAELKAQIPVPVKSLDKRKVAVKGYMLPLKVEGGLITELLIMRDQSMCCYGTVPKINEWVSVKMVGKGVKPVMDEPITIFGTLKVGEVFENGYLVGLYEMDGERLGGPIDL
ncbi:MAG: DUF3299 domain-containing protein [Pedosphaera sp.]|nr:DUF3299 domain-containing protein [Pedosphaera sp.]MST00319.1 DUF3299 domain-containing protein [Pedosphaera sp.]